MTHTPSSSQSQPDLDAEALRNPDTPAGELARIATRRPDLHPAILEHPRCFRALTNWIATQSATTTSYPRVQAEADAEDQADDTGPSDEPGAVSQQSARPGEAPGKPQSSAEADQQPDQPGADPAPSGVRRRSVTKALPIGIGIAVVGALTGVGAWRLSQRPKNAAPAAFPDEQRSFSVSAMSGQFIGGVAQAWSIASFAGQSVSPAGDYLFGEFYAQSTDEQPAAYRVYPLDDSGPGSPVEVPLSSWSKDDQRDPSRFSVWTSWWGESPMRKDMVIDPHSGEVTPVPWNASSSLFLGAVYYDSALLL